MFKCLAFCLLLAHATTAFQGLFSPVRLHSQNYRLPRIGKGRLSIRMSETVEQSKNTFTVSELIPGLPSPSTPKEIRARVAEMLQRSQLQDVALQKLEEFVHDVSTHLSRSTSTKETGKKPRVVILGSGWAAEAIAQTIDVEKFEAVFVSPRSFFIFTPMLASAAAGTVEYRSITEPIRRTNPNIKFFLATANDIDFDRKEVSCTSEIQGREQFKVPYDYLVISIGTTKNTFGTPGAQQNCFFLKEIADARNLRAGILQRFEAASLPDMTEERIRNLLTFVVVGGGPSGIEMSGEMFDLIKQDLSKYYPSLIKYVRAVLIHSGKTILEPFEASMREAALAKLRGPLGIEVILQSRVLEVTDKEIVYRHGPDADAPVERLPFGLCLWAAGTAPRPLGRRIVEATQPVPSKSGRIEVDSWLRVIGVKDGSAFAVGDCAASESGALPQTGMVASQQGEYVARLLNRYAKDPNKDNIPVLKDVTDGEDRLKALVNNNKGMLAPPFQLLYLGILAYVGGNEALAQVNLAINDVYGKSQPAVAVNQAGMIGWLLWRGVYIVKQVTFRNRVLILTDWLKSKNFGRDFAIFKTTTDKKSAWANAASADRVFDTISGSKKDKVTVDLDSTNQVTFEAFRKSPVGRRMSEEDARAAFESMDRDGNGSVDRDEWRLGARLASTMMIEISGEDDEP